VFLDLFKLVQIVRASQGHYRPRMNDVMSYCLPAVVVRYRVACESSSENN